MKVFIYDNGYKLTSYIKAVLSVNSTPILTKDLSKLNDCNALLLTGGGDICPAFYGESVNLYGNYDYLTDIAEFYLLKECIKTKKQVVGVCKGMQLINVFFNGSLDSLPDDRLSNHYTFSKDVSHQITLKNGNTFTVNSMHKQRIKNLGDNLQIEAVSSDGIIEAISHKSYKVFGVQFHPERMDLDILKKFYSHFFS